MNNKKSIYWLKSLKFKAALMISMAFIIILLIISMGVYLYTKEKIFSIQFIAAFISVACISIIALLMFFLVKNIITPIDQVSIAMKEMARGDLYKQLPISGENEIGSMEKDLNILSKKLVSIYELIGKINSGESFEHTFEYVFDSFKQFIPYNRMGMAVLDEEMGTIRAEIGRSDGVDIHLVSGYSLPLSETSLKGVIESGQPRIINDLEDYYRKHPHSKSTKLILEEGIKSSLTLPLKIDDMVVGVLFFSSVYKNVYEDYHVAFLKHIANHLAISFEKGILVGNLVAGSITAIVKLAESRDNDTGKHVERVRNYSVAIARQLANNPKYKSIITERYIREIYNFSPIHDIGKVGIADSILLKPGKLTEEEFEIMKTHTLIGAQVLEQLRQPLKDNWKSFFLTGVEIALYHHEKYNGKGYPHGLKGDAIPLSARIVTVADVFDALTSKRPYKPAYSINQSLSVIKQERGESFDPDVVDAFFDCKDEIMRIYHKLIDDYGSECDKKGFAS